MRLRQYWDFLLRHQGLLGDNPRLRPMYDRLDRLGEGQRAAIHDKAEQVRTAFGATPVAG